MVERRNETRRPVDLMFNKYIEGHPYLCQALNISGGGLLAATFCEPERQPESFAVELRFPGQDHSTWLWARTVRCDDRQQALAFMALADVDRTALKHQICPVPF
jgi:hypothetical protein